jgi:hypothetical protein
MARKAKTETFIVPKIVRVDTREECPHIPKIVHTRQECPPRPEGRHQKPASRLQISKATLVGQIVGQTEKRALAAVETVALY